MLGLEPNEVRQLINATYINFSSEMKSDFDGYTEAYEIEGFDKRTARALSDLAIREMASREAIIQVVYQNNMRIQSQLEKKGIEF